jgi:hypothetical protein
MSRVDGAVDLDQRETDASTETSMDEAAGLAGDSLGRLDGGSRHRRRLYVVLPLSWVWEGPGLPGCSTPLTARKLWRGLPVQVAQLLAKFVFHVADRFGCVPFGALARELATSRKLVLYRQLLPCPIRTSTTIDAR